jgi:hypothetical protein
VRHASRQGAEPPRQPGREARTDDKAIMTQHIGNVIRAGDAVLVTDIELVGVLVHIAAHKGGHVCGHEVRVNVHYVNCNRVQSLFFESASFASYTD